MWHWEDDSTIFLNLYHLSWFSSVIYPIQTNRRTTDKLCHLYLGSCCLYTCAISKPPTTKLLIWNTIYTADSFHFEQDDGFKKFCRAAWWLAALQTAHFKYYLKGVPNPAANWITALHLNYNPDSAATPDIRRLPQVNPQSTAFLFSQ